MKKWLTLLIVFFVACCHTGDFREYCNDDGTCNAPTLECSMERCDTKSAPVTLSHDCASREDCLLQGLHRAVW